MGWLKAIYSAMPAIARDLAGVGGGGLICYGAWLIFEPAGYILLGVMLLAVSVLSAWRAEVEAAKKRGATTDAI
jgi:hypothetical protein